MRFRIAPTRRAAFVLLFVVACSSPNPYIDKRETLGRAYGKLEEQQLSPAAHELEGLLTTTGSEADKFVLQRFYATYLLTQAHMRASAGQPFLKDVSSGSANYSIGSSSGASRGGSNIGHLVAATMYASLAEEWAGRASGASAVERGEPLLPEPLAGVEVDKALKNLKMCQLVVRTQLGFTQDVKRAFDENPELRDDKTCNALMDQLGLYPGLRPWVNYAAFEYLKDRKEQAAFRFGAQAILAEDAIGPRRAANIARWIDSESPSVFRCPACKAIANPRMRGCADDPIPLIDFFPAEPRPKK